MYTCTMSNVLGGHFRNSKFQWSMHYQKLGGHLLHGGCLIYPLCIHTRRFTQSFSLMCTVITYLWLPVIPELSSSFFLFLPLPSPAPPPSPIPPEWEDEGWVEEEEGGSRPAPSDWLWLAMPRLERRKSRSSSSIWGTHTAHHVHAGLVLHQDSC